MHSLQPTLGDDDDDDGDGGDGGDDDDDDGDDGNADGDDDDNDDGEEAILCFDQKFRGTLEFCTLGEVVALITGNNSKKNPLFNWIRRCLQYNANTFRYLHCIEMPVQ